jgi:hypothetical protein
VQPCNKHFHCLHALAMGFGLQVGNVHFLVLDSETPSHPGSLQHQFVTQDLAAVDRSTTPWIVVGWAGTGFEQGKACDIGR